MAQDILKGFSKVLQKSPRHATIQIDGAEYLVPEARKMRDGLTECIKEAEKLNKPIMKKIGEY